MLHAPNLDDLSARIRERLGPDPPAGRGPFILFLGEGCARAAGAPSREDLAREALKTFGYDSGNVSGEMSADEVFDRFARHTSSLSSSQFARMLRSLYANIPVPSFYQDLALLIREQYFPLVLTMNFDTLLEQALSSVGVRSSQYRVTTFGRGRTSSQADTPAPPLTHLVKLHGDLAQNVAHVTPEEIESALNESRSWIKADLAGDIIMVAHEFSDDPINRWLAHTPDRELWWVNSEPPAEWDRVRSWTTRQVGEVVGELGQPNVFFSQLAHRLLRAPEAAAIEASEAEAAAPGARKAGETLLPGPLSETLRQEILRNQAVLSNLERDRSPAQEDPQFQAQILYQKRRMSRLEERFRSLPDVQPRVVEAVKEIASRIRTASLAKSADVAEQLGETLEGLASYVDAQVEAVQKELTSSKPNQVLISASLCATLAVADRLRSEYGDAVVNAQDVRQLAALVPTVAGKVVL